MRWIALFCVLASVYPCYGQPPKVVVDVAIAATEAAKDDQPVLPDDFGQDARAVSAKWMASESTGERGCNSAFKMGICKYHKCLSINVS